ncbi:MAG: hypothetical protein HY360_23825 [Verrucomicrobia bacterium]|nr:hypothetical protein [Verrucomicrobiota bacterium]
MTAWLLPGFLSLAGIHTDARAELLSLDPATGAGEMRFKISPARTGQLALLEILDAKSGHCVKTLHAGPMSSPGAFTLNKGRRLPPGPYRARYREGIDLVFDSELLLPGNEKWINPADLAITSAAIFVLDPGIPPDPKSKKQPSKEAGNEAPAEPGEPGQTYLYKFLRDGKPDVSFGDRGRLTLAEKPSRIHSVVVDETGLIYAPGGGHFARVLAPNGDALGQTVGGWDNQPYGPKCTPWVNSLALGPNRRIYVACTSYATIKVYDRTKDKFDGILYSLSNPNLPHAGLMDRCLAADGRGAIYMTTRDGQVLKIVDDGKSLAKACKSKVKDALLMPVGPSAGGDLVWIADHGPGRGPFWDSGGGGEVLCLWDNGETLILVERFGLPGTARDKAHFLNPSSVAQTQDHLELWVAEDGLPNKEGPPGNARVRKFRIAAAQTEEVPFEWQGAP